MTCKLCGRPLDNPRQAWKENIGWVSPKGAKSMTGAKSTGALAHIECVALLRSGVRPEQTSMYGEENHE